MSKRLGAVVGASALFGSLLAVSTPASAALPSFCSMGAGTPTTNGVTVTRSASAGCSNGAAIIVRVGANLQKATVLGQYSTIASTDYAYSGGTTYLPYAGAVDRNGVGTYTYRSVATACDSSENCQTVTGNTARLTS